MSGQPIARNQRSVPGARTTRTVGAVLVVVAVVGFLTVADDLRHVGELAGVSSLLVAGCALLTASFRNRVSAVADLRWLAALVLVGALVGTAFDRTVLGVLAGAGAGIGAALLLARRGPTSDSP
jgi:hypothetical protein